MRAAACNSAFVHCCRREPARLRRLKAQYRQIVLRDEIRDDIVWTMASVSCIECIRSPRGPARGRDICHEKPSNIRDQRLSCALGLGLWLRNQCHRPGGRGWHLRQPKRRERWQRERRERGQWGELGGLEPWLGRHGRRFL